MSILEKVIERFEKGSPSNIDVLIAIDAIKKQIPLIPIQSFYNEGDYVWECPICENIVGEGQHHCVDCGQRFDVD